MTKQKKLALAVAGALGVLASTGANAGIGLKAGEWDLDFGGNVNGFYTNNSSSAAATPIAGGLAVGTGQNSAQVRNGLLPGALTFTAKTRQSNLDISTHFGFYPGITDASAVNGVAPGLALGSGGIDMRQVFLTFGDKSWGTVKIGRDIGIYGSNAILSDMTLLGVGSPGSGAAAPGNTSLGRIGVGYIYTDFKPQITYTSPSANGFQFSGGLFQGFDATGGTPGGAALFFGGHDQPALEAQASYDWKGEASGKAWLGFFSQKSKLAGGGAGGFTGTAWELGGKVGVGAFEGVASWYTGKGVGTTGLMLNAVDSLGNKRDSNGYYIQGTFKATEALKLGLSYGESKLKLASGEALVAANAFGTASGNLVDKNKSTIFGAYYNLTKSLTLVGEYLETKANNQSGAQAKDNTLAIGAILFF